MHTKLNAMSMLVYGEVTIPSMSVHLLPVCPYLLFLVCVASLPSLFFAGSLRIIHHIRKLLKLMRDQDAIKLVCFGDMVDFVRRESCIDHMIPRAKESNEYFLGLLFDFGWVSFHCAIHCDRQPSLAFSS